MVDTISLKNQVYGCLQTSAKNAHQAYDYLLTTLKNNSDEIKQFGGVLGAGLVAIPILSFLACCEITSDHSDAWPPMRGQPISVCMMNNDPDLMTTGLSLPKAIATWSAMIGAVFTFKWTATAVCNRFG